MFELTIQQVLIITAIAWHYALFCGFVSDDHAVIEKRKDIIPDGEKKPKQEKYWIKVFNDGIVMFYLNKVMRRIAGQSPFMWHLLNYSLHLLNTYLFYIVLSQIFDKNISLYITLLWAINPMINQVVVWCSGRPYVIATAFALISLLHWDKPYIVLPLYLLGTITSMTIAFIPIFIKILHPLAWQSNLYIGLIFLMMPFVIWKFAKRFGSNALVLDRKNYHFKLKRFNNLARVYMYYIFCLIFPVKMGWYHESGFRYNDRWNKFNVWSLIGYASIFTMMKSGISGIWFILGMLPNMNLFATNSFLQDRYLYFGSMGFFMFIVPYLRNHPEILIAIAAIYVAKSYTYSRQMVNDEKLYRENVRNHPASDYAYNNLGYFLIQQQRFDEARVVALRGLAIDRNNKLLWYNLGITWAATAHLRTEEGKFRFLRAMDCWKMALQIEPRWAKPAEDLKKLIKFLLDNKVLTQIKAEAAPSSPTVNLPVDEKEADK